MLSLYEFRPWVTVTTKGFPYNKVKYSSIVSLKNLKKALNGPLTIHILCFGDKTLYSQVFSISKDGRWNLSWLFWQCLKGCCCFFFLIWHAARTYGRRRGNIIVSNFWMSSCIWRGPRCAHFVTLGGQWGGGVKQVRSGPYTLHAVADPLDVLISRSQNGRIWIWIQIISLCCVINSTYLYLKIYFLLFLKGVS